MKKMLFVFLILSANLSYGQKLKDDPAYKALEAMDDDYRSALDDGNGNWKKPLPKIMQTLKALKWQIASAANQMGVDPVMVGAAIMTENSINVTIEDDVQDLLMKLDIVSNGAILGKKMSFGLGQLYFDAAREAENYMAKLQNRRPRSDKEINDALSIPEKNIELVAMVVRKTQDDYKRAGFDISKNVGATATLYNLGQSERRAREAKKNKRQPRSNFFGTFAEKYKNDLNFLRTSPPKPVSAASSEKSADVALTSSSEGANVVAVSQGPGAGGLNIVNASYIVPHCSSTGPKLDHVFAVKEDELGAWSADDLKASLVACGKSIEKLETELKQSSDQASMLKSLQQMKKVHLANAVHLMKDSGSVAQVIQFAKVCEQFAHSYDVKVDDASCKYKSLEHLKEVEELSDSAAIKKILMNPKSFKYIEDQSEAALKYESCGPQAPAAKEV